MSRSMTHPGWQTSAGTEYWREMGKTLGRTQGFQEALSNPTTVGNIYEGFFRKNEPSLGHYFASLVELLSYLDRGDIDDQKSLSRLLRAQLSSNELNMIFYHGFSPIGAQQLKPYLEKYGLLKFLQPTSGGNVRHYYAASAYLDYMPNQ